MPKVIEYPRASIRAALTLAQAVDELGGSSTVEMAADKLGKKRGGAFQALVGATVKYGLVEHRKGRLVATPQCREYKLAYGKDEQNQVVQRAFLAVPLFKQVFDRFREHKLPVDHFEKLLIREFDVDENVASRVAMYFIEGAKLAGLLNADNTFSTSQREGAIATDKDESGNPAAEADVAPRVHAADRVEGVFSVRITGPGIDSVVTITEEEDLEIVRMMLKKVQKQLSLSLETKGERSERSKSDQKQETA